MPSFKLLPDLEVEALVDYVKYLSIRGEVERALLMRRPSNSKNDKRLVRRAAEGATTEEKTAQQEQMAAVKDVVAEVVGNWDGAASGGRRAIPPRPEHDARTSWRHRSSAAATLFYGTVANCIKCHGDSALGDGQTTDYDEWTKEFIDDGKDPQLVADLCIAGPACRRGTSGRATCGRAFIAAGCGRSTSIGGSATASKARRCPPCHDEAGRRSRTPRA